MCVCCAFLRSGPPFAACGVFVFCVVSVCDIHTFDQVSLHVQGSARTAFQRRDRPRVGQTPDPLARRTGKRRKFDDVRNDSIGIETSVIMLQSCVLAAVVASKMLVILARPYFGTSHRKNKP